LASQINASNSGFGGIVSTGDSSGQLQLQTAGTTALTINTSQNVGIGTTSPSYKLEIGTTSDSSISANIKTSTTGTGNLFFSDTNNGQGGITYNHTSDYMRFLVNDTERMRIDSSGSLLVGPSSAGTYPYNTINAVNYKRQLTSGTAQAVFTFAKTNTTVSSSFRTSFMGTLYVAFSGRTSGGTTSAYGFTANVNIASTAGGTISMAAGSVTSLNGVSSGLTVSCAVSLTSASATSANLSLTITQTAGTLQDNELTVSLIGANSSTDSTSFFTVTPA
jgi:trimeric autotransporter adhesin